MFAVLIAKNTQLQYYHKLATELEEKNDKLSKELRETHANRPR